MILPQNARQIRSMINLLFYTANNDQAIWLTIHALSRNTNTDILMTLTPAQYVFSLQLDFNNTSPINLRQSNIISIVDERTSSEAYLRDKIVIMETSEMLYMYERSGEYRFTELTISAWHRRAVVQVSACNLRTFRTNA